MITRRQFIQSSFGALAAAANARAITPRSQPLGVQLYTVRSLTQRDLPRVLAGIRRIGYEEVETYWDVYSHPATELKRMIEDHGLRVPSGHFDYDGLEGKLDYAATLGVQFIVCPMLPPQLRTLDGFKRAADQFNKWGAQIERMGMQLGFHTHNYEFARYGGTTGFDILVKETDPNLMCFEIDCYWVTEAGRDPVKMIETLGRRVRLLHMKDRKRGFPLSQTLNAQAEHFTPVGTGTIDWKAVIAAAKRDGIRHYFVEQDSGPPAPMECLRISYRNLRPLI
ncbi:MAG TPA: sugar phosphate isomerase/epimerase [Candidatus Acidoferrales bacterium]|nr:sugar phosphate isomerase/epimerase [Candidatus Acidoferrales bacterium]